MFRTRSSSSNFAGVIFRFQLFTVVFEFLPTHVRNYLPFGPVIKSIDFSFEYSISLLKYAQVLENN